MYILLYYISKQIKQILPGVALSDPLGKVSSKESTFSISWRTACLVHIYIIVRSNNKSNGIRHRSSQITNFTSCVHHPQELLSLVLEGAYWTNKNSESTRLITSEKTVLRREVQSPLVRMWTVR